MHSITTVAVIGSGYMGGGIAQTLAAAGLTVRIADATADLARTAHARILAEAAELETSGLMPAGHADRVRLNLSWSESLPVAVDGADFIEEAVPEDPDTKRRVLAEISAAAAPAALIGTNTSTIPLARLADAVSNPSRFLVVHFSNPAHLVPGVELVAGAQTADSAVAAIRTMLTRIGRPSAVVEDAPGFVLNRVQYAMVKEALLIVQEGHATPEDVDTILRSTLGFRAAFFGPLAMLDMAGLDVYADSFRLLADALGDRFAPPEILTEAADAGRHGMKNGAGLWRDYTEADTGAIQAWRAEAYSRMSALLADLPPAPTLTRRTA
ncbi:3-hydroxyacyl-CoA dehydrogenase family protein [Occultella gossypii]|nr:3-hydroxyacyl-CoA dehydrogenase family protein [Occultella gossypii]